MSQSEIVQFDKLINSSNHILITLPENPQGDHFCSAIAFAHFCDLKNIVTTLAFHDPYEQTSLFEFLSSPKDTKITNSIAGTRDLIITFNTKYNKILDVKTNKVNNEIFQIYVTPEKGVMESRDMSFSLDKFPYDLIVTIGATDKEAMGKIYEEIPDIFYELPIINIDNKSANEQFGQLNIVDPVASSTSEIFSNIFENITQNNISRNCAQCLLAGIISETHSFQNHNTTPQAMTTASKLIEYGADQQTIIHNLYRNLPFSLLQLWGRAMKNAVASKNNKNTIITTLSQKDINQTNAKPNHVYSILEKLKENYPSGKIFILIYEDSLKNEVALIDMNRTNTNLTSSDIEELEILPNNIYKIPLHTSTTETSKEEICTLLKPFVERIK